MPEKEMSHSTLPRNSMTPLVLAYVDETRNSQHATRKYQFKLMHAHRNLLSSVNFFIELKLTVIKSQDYISMLGK